MRIALLEDDKDQAAVIQLWLESAGHDSLCANTGKDFMQMVSRESFDLYILDWMLPDTSGDKVLVWLREHVGWDVPVLFITARDSEECVVQGLQTGADDYMVKPVTQKETLARIAALGRRAYAQAAQKEMLAFNEFKLDLKQHAVYRHGEPVPLTQREYDLVLFLFRHKGQLLSRGHILESVWGQSAELNTRTVDTHMSRIRNKLGLVPENGWKLSAIYQHGYRLEHLDDADEAQLSQ